MQGRRNDRKQEYRVRQGAAQPKPYSAYLVAPDSSRRVYEAGRIGRPESIFGIYTDKKMDDVEAKRLKIR